MRLEIPEIDLDEPVIELGLTADGHMEVPSDYDDVGWFSGGGRPGGIGPTVLAGHVDSATGPAVFDRLREVSRGDVVTLENSSGVAANYRVESAENYSKSSFPTVDVFGAIQADVIRLITCSGAFDEAVGSYDKNFVVFAVRY